MPSITFSILALGALVTFTNALSVTNPNKDTVWDSGKTNTITWSSVSTDQASFDIYLSHMSSQPQINSLLFQNVKRELGSIDVAGFQLPVGTAFQINLVAHDKPEQIYSQSAQFNITGEGVAASKTIDGYTGPTHDPSANKPGHKKGDESASASSTPIPTASESESESGSVSATHSSTSTKSGHPTGAASPTKSSNGTIAASGLPTPSNTPSSAIANVATSTSVFALVMAGLALLA